MLNPFFPAKGVGYSALERLGTQELTASGTWSKSAARTLSFLTNLHDDDMSAVVVEVEAVGGGGGGQASASGAGGYPGGVFAVQIRWSELPESVAVTVGDGGSSGATGGTTYFGSVSSAYLVGPGGLSGTNVTADMPSIHASAQSRSSKRVAPNPVSSTQSVTYPSLRPDSSDGPGGGGSYGLRGGIAQASRNTATAHGEPNLPGSSASSTDSYGGGGGGRTSAGVGGAGGAPGGGGGNGPTGGAGGRGAIRLRYSILRSV